MITKFNMDLASCDHKFECLTGDLANMYTSLDHSSIRTAIRWVLFDTQKKRFRDPSQKLSVVVSALHRICMSSSSLAAFTSAFTDLKSELRSLLYPDSVITKAFNRVISHSRFTALS